MLNSLALLIEAETDRKIKFINKLQPISVGVLRRLPGSSNRVARLKTLMKIEVKFTSIPFLMSGFERSKKTIKIEL